MEVARRARARPAWALALVPGLVLGLGACAASPPPVATAIGTVEQVYDGALTPDLAVATFSNIDRLFPSRTIAAAGEPRPLPPAQRSLENVVFDWGGARFDLYDVLALDSVVALVVLKDGRVAYESYQRGVTAETRWMSMSIAKSITSTLVGAAIEDGLLPGLDALVVDYVPELRGSAYEGVTVRDVLMMSSGVAWNETYTDPASDRRAMLRAQIAQRRGALMEVMAARPRAAEPGTANAYSTGETQVLGEVVMGAVSRPLAEYLSEKIWTPYGMEADATWWLDAPEEQDGHEIGGSGIAATPRDYARFGQFVLGGGMAGGRRVVPEGWFEEAVSPKRLADGTPLDYGYMWWPATSDAGRADGAFSAVGIQGQYVYVNPARRVVIAMFSAQPKPTGREPIDAFAFFEAVAAALD